MRQVFSSLLQTASVCVRRSASRPVFRYHHRHYDGSSAASLCAGHRFASSAASHPSSSTTATTTTTTRATSLPLHAYAHRLRSLQCASLTDLAGAPLSPSPIIVLRDVLLIAMRSSTVVTEAEGGDADVVSSRKARQLLSSPRGIQRLLRANTTRIRNAVDEAREMGGEEVSAAQLRKVAEEVDEVLPLLLQLSDSETNGEEVISLYGRVCIYRELLPMVAALGLLPTAVMLLERLEDAARCATAAIAHTKTADPAGQQGGSEVAGVPTESAEDDVVSLDELVAQQEELVRFSSSPIPPPSSWLGPPQYLAALQSCVPMRAFDAAFGLFQRLQSSLIASLYAVADGDGRYSEMAQQPLKDGLIALAQSCRHHEDWEKLRHLLVDATLSLPPPRTSSTCEPQVVPLTTIVPVSSEFYAAMISAIAVSARSLLRPLSPAAHHRLWGMQPAGKISRHHSLAPLENDVETVVMQHLSAAFSFYRQLRDAGATLSADVYSALMATCAYCREPTHAFAFHHEARVVCGLTNFPPSLYTALLLSYHYGGYGADAVRALSVLMESGAPLERAAFHAALACCPTKRDAEEIIAAMQTQYRILPTPHTYAFMIQAAVRRGGDGVKTILTLHDIHEEVMRLLAERLGVSREQAQERHRSHKLASGGVNEGDKGSGDDLEAYLLAHYQVYIVSLTHALMSVRVDPSMDPRLLPYLKPLQRLCQRHMNATIKCAPQCPTVLPTLPAISSSSRTAAAVVCVAVIAGDVLSRLEEWLVPHLDHYSVLLVPFSSLLHALHGSGGSGGGEAADPDLGRGSSSPGTTTTEITRSIVRFLRQYKSSVHLMSLEEEMLWSRDLSTRYAIPRRHWLASAAGITMHAARADVTHPSIYRVKPPPLAASSITTTPVSAAAVAARVSRRGPAVSSPQLVLMSSSYSQCGHFLVMFQAQVRRESTSGPDGPSLELQAAMEQVMYHNPETAPHWAPPHISVVGKEHEEDDGGSRAGYHPPLPLPRAAPPPSGNRSANGNWKRKLLRRSSSTPSAAGATTASISEQHLELYHDIMKGGSKVMTRESREEVEDGEGEGRFDHPDDDDDDAPATAYTASLLDMLLEEEEK